MSPVIDYEKACLLKFSDAIDSIAGENVFQMAVDVEIIESLFTGGTEVLYVE